MNIEKSCKVNKLFTAFQSSLNILFNQYDIITQY